MHIVLAFEIRSNQQKSEGLSCKDKAKSEADKKSDTCVVVVVLRYDQWMMLKYTNEVDD